MKPKLFFLFLLVVFLTPLMGILMQDDTPTPHLEITGVNANDTPTILVSINVFDPLGQPITGLTQDDFTLSGELVDVFASGALSGTAEIVNVQNITAEDLPLSAVLAIDTSSSMDGPPIQRAKEAAILFVDALRDQDSVAIISFDTRARLVQDYTTDKALLRRVITEMTWGGQTALYDAALMAVDVAAQSPNSRRAVIILSDGAEYGGRSTAAREAAIEAARIRGVSVYTIGLGYGHDRSYLQQLSGGTNSRNYELPEPEELLGIYGQLAALLRSQYEVTLHADLPLDGQEYEFGLQAETALGTSNLATASVRAPIPVPVVTLTGMPEGVIDTVTTVTASVAADDALETVNYTLDGALFDAIPGDDGYVIEIDPEKFAPGVYTLIFTATDINGDSGSAAADFEIATLPPVVAISPDLTGLEINEPTTITLEASGQTEITGAAFTLAGETTELTEAPFSFTIDPVALQPGEQTLTIDVTNAGGATTSASHTFTVAAFPAEIAVSGIESGQVFEGSFMPEDVVSVTVEVLSSQTDVTEVVYTLDGEVIATLTEAPYTLDLNLLEGLGTGQHTLEVAVTNAGGKTISQATTFSVRVVPTATPMPSPTATIDTQATANAQATSDRQAAIEAQATADSQATSDAQAALDAQATVHAEASVTVQAELDANAQATVDAEATANTIASATAQAGMDEADIQATTYAQATVDAEASATTQAGMDAADIQATANAQATVNAEDTATAQAGMDAADIQATTDAHATVSAEASAVAQAELEAANAQATLDSSASATAQAELEAANAQATLDAEASATAQTELDAADAQATLDAEASATAQTELDEADTQATASAQETANALATAESVAAAATTVPTDTSAPEATITPRPTVTPIGELTERDVENVPEEKSRDILPYLAAAGAGLLVLLIALVRRGGKKK